MATSRADAGCPSGEDLTALAHGGLPGEVRERLSRHLLGCPACRAEYGGTRSLFRRLASLGPAWRDELAAAGRTPVPPARRAVALGALVAAVLLAAFLLPAGMPGGASGVPTAAAACDVEALLAAQRTDGSWSAEARLGGPRRDESATALAVLALLPADATTLREGPVARALASASRWLIDRQRERGAAPDATAVENDALSTSALLALYAATGDAAVRDVLDRSVRRVAHAAALPLDRPALAGARDALVRARDLGWRRLDGALQGIDARLGPADGALARSGGWSSADPHAPCELALHVLASRPR